MNHYFLSVTIAGKKFEQEVSLEEFCRAERAAGFFPKMPSDDPSYMTTPATGGFGGHNGINGRITTDWKVTADHPVLARPDKFGMTRDEAAVFANSLQALGYENIEINIDATIAARYEPESSFICDGNLVYNLRQVGWREGKPEMANDVAVTIQAHHLSPEIQADIANTICAELNKKYTKK